MRAKELTIDGITTVPHVERGEPAFGAIEAEHVRDFNAEMADRGITGFEVSAQDFRDLWRLPLKRLRKMQDIVGLQFRARALSARDVQGLQARESLYAHAVDYKEFGHREDREAPARPPRRTHEASTKSRPRTVCHGGPCPFSPACPSVVPGLTKVVPTKRGDPRPDQGIPQDLRGTPSDGGTAITCRIMAVHAWSPEKDLTAALDNPKALIYNT